QRHLAQHQRRLAAHRGRPQDPAGDRRPAACPVSSGLRAWYSSRPAATARFSDSTVPVIGIRTWASPAASTSSGSPAPSAPSSRAGGRGWLAPQRLGPAWAGVVPPVPPDPPAQAKNSAASAARATGTANSAPIDALTAAGSNGSAAAPTSTTP